jgi:hypothetical protein
MQLLMVELLVKIGSSFSIQVRWTNRKEGFDDWRDKASRKKSSKGRRCRGYLFL